MIHLNSTEIHKDRWNTLVKNQSDGLPYAYSEILDKLTGDRWDAIIDKNYEWILPLPYNRKLVGLKQYYTPYCLQQLGVIGKQPDKNTWKEIYKIIGHKSIRSNLALNEKNNFEPGPNISYKPNFVLSLASAYENIMLNYKKNLQQVLKKKELHHIRFSHGRDLTGFLKFYFRFTFKKFSSEENISPQYIQTCYKTFSELGLVNTLMAADDSGNIFAGLLYLKTNQRIIISLQSADPDMRHFSGPSLLIDELIKMYAGSGQLLDFEGSAIPSIANFYRGFNPEERSFGVLKIR